MSLLEAIFNAVFNVLSVYIYFRVVKLFVIKKETPVLLQAVVYFMVWIINFAVHFYFNNMYITTLTLFFLLLIATFILYEGKLIGKFLSAISAIAFGILFEEIVWNFLVWLEGSRPNSAVGSLLSSFLYIVSILVIERFFCSRKMEYIPESSYFNFILILTGSIILVEVLAKVEQDYEWTLIGLSAICLINVSTFYLYDKAKEAYYKALDGEVMEEKIAMHDNQISLMKQFHENIHSLWHDMKNHLILLETYLNEKEYKKASQYIKNILNYMYVPGQYVNSGNYEVDAILNYRLAKADKMGCRIETDLKVPDSTFMSDFDLNMLLGNLLDNALEALEHVKERYLRVELRYQKGVLVIHIRNSYDGKLQQKGKDLLTRKKDKENHGWGLWNVEQIVKKYSGEQIIKTEGALFTTSIVLYVTLG